MKVTLIARGIVLPMEGRKMVHAVGSVLVGDNTILAVGPADEVAADPRAAGADVVEQRDVEPCERSMKRPCLG